MNLVQLVEELGANIQDIGWRITGSNQSFEIVRRIVKRKDGVVYVEARLPLCGTWVSDAPWTESGFLRMHKPAGTLR